MAATEELLGLLHEAVAQDMIDRLKEAKDKPEKQLSPQELSVIVKFLKDNGIEALPADNSKLRKLSEQLPEFGEGEGLHAKH